MLVTIYINPAFHLNISSDTSSNYTYGVFLKTQDQDEFIKSHFRDPSVIKICTHASKRFKNSSVMMAVITKYNINLEDGWMKTPYQI